MDARTRPRGSSDTAWIGQLFFGLASVLVHLIPVALYFGSLLLGLRWFAGDAGGLEDHVTIIPIEFGVDELDEPRAGEPPEPPPVKTATLEEPAALAETAPKPVAAADGGPADAAPDGTPDAAADAPVDSPPDAPGDALQDRLADVVDAATPDAHDAGEVQPAAVDAAVDVAAPLDTDAAVASLPSDGGAAALSADAAAAGVADGSSDAGAADARPYEAIRDPVAVAGDARLVAQQNPNVSLMVYTGRIRRHPLASRHAATLTAIHQWRVFFEGSGLDPVRDTDWILLVGPQFRNTSRISVVLRYNVPEARMRAAVAALVSRSQPPGTWDQKNGVKYARLHIDNADRFVVFPQPKILVVVPSDGLDQAVSLKTAHFPSGAGDGTAVLLNLKTPRNAFRGIPADIPASIAWVKFVLTLTADGGADARIDAEDSDAEKAKQDAASLTEQLDKASTVRALLWESRLFDPVVLRAEGKHVRGETHFSETQLNRMLSMIGAKVDQMNRAAGAPPPR